MVVCGVSLRLIAPVIALTAVLSAPVQAASAQTSMMGEATSACAALFPAPATAAKLADLQEQSPINRRLDLDSLTDDTISRCRTSDDSVVRRDTVTEIPENPTWGALLAGMAGMAVMRYRRSRPRLPLL
jgi:hypothetical protein